MIKMNELELGLLIDAYKAIDKLTLKLDDEDRYMESMTKIWSKLYDEIELQTGTKNVDDYVYKNQRK